MSTATRVPAWSVTYEGIEYEAETFDLIEGFARLRDDGSMSEPFFPAALAEKHYPQSAQ